MRSVKRSVTIRPELDKAVVASVGERGYSSFINDAVVIALQAAGIAKTISDFEREHGRLTDADFAVAEARRSDAVKRARVRSRRFGKSSSS